MAQRKKSDDDDEVQVFQVAGKAVIQVYAYAGEIRRDRLPPMEENRKNGVLPNINP